MMSLRYCLAAESDGCLMGGEVRGQMFCTRRGCAGDAILLEVLLAAAFSARHAWWQAHWMQVTSRAGRLWGLQAGTIMISIAEKQAMQKQVARLLEMRIIASRSFPMSFWFSWTFSHCF